MALVITDWVAAMARRGTQVREWLRVDALFQADGVRHVRKMHVTCGTAQVHTAVSIVPQAHQHSSKAALHAALKTFSPPAINITSPAALCM